jgi:ABC-type transport system substrate-binding protein
MTKILVLPMSSCKRCNQRRNSSASPLYNQVVEFNPLNSGKGRGGLATSWEVTDNALTYTFHLHETVKWWDGKDLTA